MAGEVAWRIPPLAVPRAAGRQTPIEGLSQFDGVRLFVDRARHVRPHFHLSDENGPAVAGICERLERIPLALELAAARCERGNGSWRNGIGLCGAVLVAS